MDIAEEGRRREEGRGWGGWVVVVRKRRRKVELNEFVRPRRLFASLSFFLVARLEQSLFFLVVISDQRFCLIRVSMNREAGASHRFSLTFPTRSLCSLPLGLSRS